MKTQIKNNIRAQQLRACLLSAIFCLLFLLPARAIIKAQELININIATLEELDALPGIGPVKAQAIIDYRETNGPFSSIEDIINVSGIGDVTYNNLKDLITTEQSQIAEETEEQTDEDTASSTPESKEKPDAADNTRAAEENKQNQSNFHLGDVVINEFVSDPDDNDVEWIEIFCRLNQTIDLSGWKIEEGSGAKTIIHDASISRTNNFYVIKKPKGNLNNQGDIIILKDNTGRLIDKIAYGEWDDGGGKDNAPAADDPMSTARKIDGQNSYNNFNDFTLTLTPTKGRPNIITIDENGTTDNEISQKDLENYDYSRDIEITELMPNPYGLDTEKEFFEIYNSGDLKINLYGWRLGDESKNRFQFNSDIFIEPNQYLAIYRTKSKIALNNSSDSLKLFQPLKDEPLRIIKYSKAIEGWSYAKNETNQWVWTETVTPGEKNQIKKINHAPQVDFDCPDNALIGEPIIFDSSDTIDQDGDELSYAWDFGDGIKNRLPNPQHTFLTSGSYQVSLSVSDGQATMTKEKIIQILNKNALKTSLSKPQLPEDETVIINEILPDPEGSDQDNEWIEIFNNGQSRVNLINWQLDDSPGGSRPYTIVDEFYLNAGAFMVVSREESKLALNNTNDSVRLFNPAGEIIDSLDYTETFTGEAYARGENNKWFWTTVLTPGKVNIISLSKSKSISETNNVASASSVKIRTKLKENIIKTSLKKIKELEIGDRVLATGTVAVLPGILGLQYFYITASGGPGLQIYSYNKNFPRLRLGDEVEVKGELSQNSGEWRLKTKNKEDIIIINSLPEPKPAKFDCDQINEDQIGQLASITGEVVEQSGSNIYLDDGTDEARVYIKKTTGINPKNFKPGEIFSISGIISRSKTGLRLMPRSPDDIIRKDVETVKETGKVLGEVAASDEWEIAARDKKLELFQYLLIIAAAGIIILIGLLIKTKKG